MPPKRASEKAKTSIGWREWASLPDLGVDAIKVKVDTGARTSALHAFRVRHHTVDGQPWVRFEIHPTQHRRRGLVVTDAPVLGWRRIRSSNGEVQNRPVICTDIAIGDHRWPIEITLTNRDEMGFRMLLGRAAVRRRFLVDPGRSFLLGRRDQR